MRLSAQCSSSPRASAQGALAHSESPIGHEATGTPLDRLADNTPARAKTLDEGAGLRPISPRYVAICILNALPLDVLFEVFGYVDPISLLHLSRTSKALRSTLMSRSSIWIWKRSYATTNHGLPPAPKDLTIPQFLEIAVDRTCDYCHRELTEETTFYEIP